MVRYHEFGIGIENRAVKPIETSPLILAADLAASPKINLLHLDRLHLLNRLVPKSANLADTDIVPTF